MRMHRGMYMRNGFGWVIWQAISGLCAVAWRFGTGAHMDGERRSDATWLAPATAPAAGRQLSWWTAMPRLRRAGIRWGVTAVVVAVLCGLAMAPTVTRVVLVLVGLAGMAYAGWRAWKAYRARAHREKYVMPIGAAVGQLLALPNTKPSEVERWLDFPIEFFDPDRRAELRIRVSAHTPYDDKTLKAVENTICRKIGCASSDVLSVWHMVGAAPYLSMQLKERPPKFVGLEDVRAAIEDGNDGKLPFGLAANGRKIEIDFEIESAHFGFSCRAGTGKSVAVRTLIAAALYKGCQVGIIDLKMISQKWARPIPGVTYVDTGADAFDYLESLHAELRRRQAIMKSTPQGQEPNVGPRMYIIFEEQNIGMAAVGDYWDDIKNEDENKGKKNPAVRALFDISCAGRELKMHLISVAQLFDVPGACAGKPAIRANYGNIAIRGRAHAWKYLAPECVIPPPPKNKQRGRLHVVIDGEPVETQVAFMSEDEAYELAMAHGTVTVPAVWGSELDQPEEAVTGGSVTAVEGPRLYSLREAVDAGLVGDISYDNLRKLKSRDPNFPSGTTVGGRQKWDADAITEWFEARMLVESVTDSESHDDE